MQELRVDIEIQGTFVTTGYIFGNSVNDACFKYDTSYVERPAGVPISISLPFQDEPFSPDKTRNYFEGLLPESFSRKSVAKWMHADENDYLSILYGLGKECLGAVRISDDSIQEDKPSYELLSEEQVHELACEGATKSAQLVTEAHLSLTGASGKVGLYYDAGNDRWYMPMGTAPSTHILKQSHIRLDSIVSNERLALLTASKLGIDVPDSFIVGAGDKNEEDVLFATRRFDRRISAANNRSISGMPSPIRLHQEDFAQAMGVPAAQKYEEQQRGYLGKMFELLALYSADPIEDQLKLWDIIIFDYLVGNTDDHIKNISLLYGENMDNIRLAPAYDIVSTVVYKNSTRNMSIYIGGERSLDRINRDTFADAARETGFNPKMILNCFDRLSSGFEAALSEAAQELETAGFEKAVSISDTILQKGGIAAVRQNK